MKINREKALAAFQEYTEHDPPENRTHLPGLRIVPADCQISGPSGGRGGHCVADRTAP